MRELFHAHRHWLLAEGIIFLILGALAIALPMLSTLAITLLFGCLLIVGGVIQGVRLANMSSYNGKWTEWLFAIAIILTGILMIISPQTGALSLTLLMVSFFIIGGIAKIFLAFHTRTVPNWGWVLISGLLSLGLAAMIIAQWPTVSQWVLGLLLGINMFFIGLSIIALSMSLKNKERV